MVRQIKIARDTAVKARSAAIITLKTLIVNAPGELREALEPLTDRKLIDGCAALEPGDIIDPSASRFPSVAASHRRRTPLPLVRERNRSTRSRVHDGARACRRCAASIFDGTITTWIKRLGAIGGLVCVLLAGAEGLLRRLGWCEMPSVPQYPAGYFTRDPHGVTKAVPGVYRVRSVGTQSGATIYDAIYTIDALGRRHTPVDDVAGRDRFLVILGDSFVFGEGVDDRETLPARLGALAHRHMPYNYGFHGNGPYDVLGRVQAMSARTEVPEQDGIGVYLYIDDHIDRVSDSSRVAGWHKHGLYYALLPDGGFVQQGTFATARPWRTALYEALYDLRTLRLLGIGFPPMATSHRLDLTARVLEAICNVFLDRFPSAQFYVVFYPGSEYAPDIATRLRGYGTATLDYSRLFDTSDPTNFLSREDRHPSSHAYERLATALVSDLGLQ